MLTTETFVKSLLFIPCEASEGRIWPVLSVGWTLNLEMFFYMLFWICMKISHKYRGVLCVFTICLLALTGKYVTTSSIALQFWGSHFLIAFSVGIIIYFLENRLHSVKSTCICLKKTAAVAGAYLLGILFFVPYIVSEVWVFQSNLALCGLLVFLAVCFLKENKYPGWMVRIGNISYTLYLTHFFIIGFVTRKLMNNKIISFKNAFIVLCAILFTLLVAFPIDYLFQNKLYVKLTSEKRRRR